MIVAESKIGGFHLYDKLPHIFPESCLLITLGILVGVTLYFTETASSTQYTLDANTFFLFLLPPIIYDAGYHMPNKPFFNNLGTILLLAVVNTLWNTLGIGQYIDVWNTSGIGQCLLHCSGVHYTVVVSTTLSRCQLHYSDVYYTVPLSTTLFRCLLNGSVVYYTVVVSTTLFWCLLQCPGVYYTVVVSTTLFRCLLHCCGVYYTVLVSTIHCFGVYYTLLWCLLYTVLVSTIHCFGVYYTLFWYLLYTVLVSTIHCFGIYYTLFWYLLYTVLVSTIHCFGVYYTLFWCLLYTVLVSTKHCFGIYYTLFWYLLYTVLVSTIHCFGVYYTLFWCLLYTVLVSTTLFRCLLHCSGVYYTLFWCLLHCSGVYYTLFWCLLYTVLVSTIHCFGIYYTLFWCLLYTVLVSTTLFPGILHCCGVYYTVLVSTTLFRGLLHCCGVYYTVLVSTIHCFGVYYTVLVFTTLFWCLLLYSGVHYTVPVSTTLFRCLLHCCGIYYTVPVSTTLLWCLLHCSEVYYTVVVSTTLLWCLLHCCGVYYTVVVSTTLFWCLLHCSGVYYTVPVSTTLFRCLGLWGMSYLGFIHKKVSILHSFVFAALISAVDPVAVLAIFEEIQVNEILYIIVFGESLLNDGVTVVIYRMMEGFTEIGESNLEAVDFFSGILQFFIVCLGGTLIGVIYGLLGAFITKYTDHVRVIEPLFIFVLGYLAYLTSEIFELSGILALTFGGIIMRHYTEANMTKKSTTTVKYFMKLMANISETIIFMFLGLSTVIDSHDWQIDFILFSILFCLIFRVTGVIFLSFMVNRRRLIRLSPIDQFIMSYGGLRGGIAFCLALLLDAEKMPERAMFVTTTLVIVFFTVFIQGITIKPVVNALKVERAGEKDPSMNEMIHKRLIDHLMAGMEDIVGRTGDNSMKHKFDYYNTKYLKPWLLREKPKSRDTTIVRGFTKLSLQEAKAAVRSFPQGLSRDPSFLNLLQHTNSLANLYQRRATISVPNDRDREVIVNFPNDPSFTKLDDDGQNMQNVLQESMFQPRSTWVKERRHTLAEIHNHPPFRHVEREHLRHIFSDIHNRARLEGSRNGLYTSNSDFKKEPRNISFSSMNPVLEKKTSDSAESTTSRD
ncbi:Sodium/hydrogen exchanger 1 [Bulinus truncatus]|nr:Sodium/hydrogen exchanger 1 [Bulinus truncatus]